MSKRVVIALIVVTTLIGAGIAFDRQRAKERQGASLAGAAKQKVPPLPQRGALLLAADEMELRGDAICGFCHWREGGSTCNTVLQMSEEPGIVFVWPNETRSKMDTLTGAFADQKRKMKNMSGTREADIRPRVQLMPEVRPAALGGMLWYEIRPF